MRARRARACGAAAIAAPVVAVALFCGLGAAASIDGVSAAGAACSKATAVQLVDRLGLGYDGRNTREPVRQVICGAFVGRGSEAMVVQLTLPTAPGVLGWVVFRQLRGAWQLVKPNTGGGEELAAAGSDIRETVFVLRPGDAMCCPSGGTKSRIWQWNGTTLVASGWKLTPPKGSTATTTAVSAGSAPCNLAAVRSGFTNGFTSNNPPRCAGLYALAFGTSHGSDFVDMLRWNGTAWAEIRNRTAACASGDVPAALKALGCGSG